MWQFTREIKIRMESLWMSFAVVLVLVATELNAASLSTGFASSVLPGISTSSLYPSIQNVTSSTKGGFSTVEISSKYVQLSSNATSSLPSISSITKTETSVLSISETRTLISHRTTIPLESSQSLTASIEAVMNSVSSNYSVNSSSASSSFNLNSSSAVILIEVRNSSSTSQRLQTSEMSSSMQQSSMSTNMSYLSSVVSVAASQSGFVSATRTLSLTQSSPTVAKATSSQSQLSHAMTINGSSTGLSSQSIAGSSTPQLENSRMAPSSSIAMATNRTLATGHLTSSVLANASESPSMIGMSSTILASTNSTFASKSKLLSMNDTVVVTSATIHKTPVTLTMNSSSHLANATVMTTLKETIPPTHSATTTLSTESRSPVVNFTLPSSTLSSSVGLFINQTRGAANSSALSPSRSVPSLNQTVSVVKTSDLLSSSSVPLQASPVAMSSSVVVEVKSSMITAVGATSQSSSTSVPSPVGVVSSSVVSKSATMQSSTGVSLHPSTVAASSGTDSTGVVSLLPIASGEKSSPVSSTVAVSSSLLASLVATSSSVKVGATSSIATATGESSSSMSSVVSSRLVFSQNVTSQSSSYARLTSKTATLSSSSVETRMSRAASVTPNRTSIDEGLIVTSYSTPCYIYYVVEKTVLPVATANHSAVSPSSTTPKITLDIGSASSMHSGLPSVTLTHTVAMTTRVSKLQSQVVSSTDLLTSSTGLVGVSANSSQMMPSSTSTHLMSTVLISSSETVSKVMVSHTSKVVQTESLTATSVTPSGTSSIFSDRRNTSDASTFKTLVQSQPGTLAIPRVTASVVELQSTPMINRTLVASPTTSSNSFIPIVASASVSEMQNVSTAFVTGTSSSSKHESLQSSHGSSPVASRSSDESRSFVPTVAPSLPSQGISSAGTVSAASQVISSNSTTVTVRSSDELVLPSKSGSIAQTTVSSKTPTIAISETSSERQTASSPSRHTNTTEASDVLVMKTTTLSPMPSPTTSGLLLSVAANETATSSISSPSVLLRSLATVSENRTFTTVSSKASIPVESVEHSQNSSLVQSSTMASVDPSSSSVLSSSHIHASPSASLVMATLSEPKVSSMSTEIKSSPQVDSSSLQLTADNKTTTSNIEMSPSSSSIHPSSNVSSSVVEPQSSAMVSQTGTTSTPTSSSNQVAAASSSLSQSGNKTSASNTQMSPQSSVMPSLSASTSQAGATSVPANSSPQVATSSSVSQANSTSSPVEHLPSSSSPLEASSSISSSKRRRKKRAIGDTNSTTLGVHSSSSVVVTSLLGEPVASASQDMSAVSSVVPFAPTASQTLQISNGVMLSVEGGSSQGLVATSVLTLSGQSQSVSEPLPSPSVSVDSSLSAQVASFSGNFTPPAALPTSSPSASSVSIQKPTGNTTSGSSAILMATGSATSGVSPSPSLHVNVTESHTGSVAQSPSSATVHVSLTPSGTVTQSRGVLVSSSTESLVPQVSETVGSMTTHANLSVTNVVGTMASSSSGVVSSIHVSREQSSSLDVAISSILVDNHTLSSTSSRDIVTSSVELGNIASSLAQSVSNVSSSVQSSSVLVKISSVFDNRTLPSTSSLDLKPSESVVLPNSTSSLAQSVTRFSPSAQSSLVAVVISSTSVDSGSLPSTSSSDLKPSASAVSGNSSSTLAHSVTSVSSSVQSLSASAIMSSTFVDNRTLLSTSSQDLMMSSAVLGNSSSTLAHSTTDPSQPSTVTGKGSVTASSFVVVVPSPTSVSLGSSSSSLTQQPRESSITISSSPQPTIIKNVTSTVSSSPSSFSIMLSALQSSSEMTSLPSPSSPSQLSSPTTDPASQAVSSSVLTRPSPSAVQSSEIQQTVAASSSVTIASSSRVYRPPLVTISSLGICYVVYTTRIVQPSLVSTLPVSMSSTVSVNASSTPGFSAFTHSASATSIQLSPSLSLNTSSAVVQTTLDVNATSSQSPQVVSTAVSVNVTVKPSGSSSSVFISTTIPPVNSTTSRPALTSSSLKARTSEVTQSANVSQSRVQKSSTLSSTIFLSSVALTAAHSIKETPLPTSTRLLSTQMPTSQVVSPTRTVSQVVSSSATLPPTQPQDRSLLIEAIFNVPQNTDIQSQAFKEDLEVSLADAYRFAELTSRRRRRATPEINATIDSIQRVNNTGDVNVTFFITKDGQRVPASDAAQNYEKLSKAQLGSLVKLDVVSMPQPLVVPTTPPLPSNILVSLIIQDSASNNISIAENRNRLENNLAAYYNEKKQLTTAKATIKTILHEPNEIVYLEFYITVDGQAVNASVVVETFQVPHVNLLTAKLGVQVLVQVYIPDSLTANEADYVIIGVSVPENQDLTNASFRSDLANKLVTLYQTAKGKKNRRRKKRSGSTSATIKDIVRNPDSTASEADVTFFVFDAGKVVNASYVVTVMNRLSTNEMTTVTRPYAVLSAPRRAIVPTSPTEITPTVAQTEIKWWIIPAVLCPILLIIVIILLICWRWKKGAPKSRVEPDTIRMLDTNKRKPVQGFDVARYTEPGVSGMKETSFVSRSPPSIADDEEAAVKPARRETSLRRKVQKQKPPVREQRQTNPAYEEEEEEEEEEESVVSVTPPGSTEALTRGRAPAAKPPSASRKTPAKPQRPVEPSESEEDSELSEDVSESEPESVPQPQQTRHSAAQVPTVAVMSEASGPPRYPPVRFRSSVHPAPTLPPLDAKQTSLVGVKVEPPSEDDSTRGQRKRKVTKRELEQRADLERQKNKQRLRDRKRNSSHSPGFAVPNERKAWDRAQHDFDDVLGDEDAERVITGKKRKPRRRRPPSSSVATDEEGVPHLKSYRKLKSPKTTSSTTSTRDRGKKHGKSADSASNASSDESEIDMNETRRRMHAMLDDAFSLFGPQLSKKLGKESERQPAAHPEAHPETYPATPARPAVIPRYIGGQPALPEPPPAHGRATEPTPRQRRRVQPTMPGYPAGMPQAHIGMPGYPGHPPARPVVTRDPIVVWDPADRQRILNQQAPPPTYAYRDPSGQNVYITPVQQQRDDMGGLVWSPYAAEDSMEALYPDLAQASYPGALSTSPPKDTSFLSRLQAAPPHDTVLNMSAGSTLDQRGASLGQSPQPLIKSIKDELFRLSQGASRKTPITEL